MADRLLLRGGSVVSMDPDVGNLPKGDVLIEGDKIVQIAPNIQADAQVIDVTGDIVIPGLIDTHRHTWECAIRGCAPNATLDDHFVEVLDTFSPGSRSIFLIERWPADNAAGHPRSRLLRRRRRYAGVEDGARARPSHYGPCRHGPAGRAVRHDQTAAAAQSARLRHHLHPLLLLQR